MKTREVPVPRAFSFGGEDNEGETSRRRPFPFTAFRVRASLREIYVSLKPSLISLDLHRWRVANA